ncbi:MAG: two-component system, OmpR family, sensor histidine kinase VicK [Parcubacteria bacterium C7867-005]|nr:MAG: two-component system, OmpR family, sensor histidine kinase VicK [Parcubacteria bacterium C7867-005]
MRKKLFMKVVVLSVVYFSTAWAGLQLGAVSGFATFVWPPTGIALAALLIFGYRLWPGIFLAAFLVNLVTGAPVFVALAIGAGNTLEAVFGKFILHKVGFDVSLEHRRDVLAYIIYGALLSTIVSASIGSGVLWSSSIVSSVDLLPTWIAWWVGDILGALIIGSFILSFRKMFVSRQIIFPSRRRVIEAVLLCVALIIFNSFVFFNDGTFSQSNASLVYLIFPLLIWAALRFEVAGATIAVFITSALAIWGTVSGTGPFVTDSISSSLFSLQVFMGSVSVTILVLSAIVEESARAYRALEKADKSKSEFVSIASHQLRTPLSTVKWYVRTLLDSKLGKVSDKQNEYLSELNNANERMIKLVNTLLDVSKIELGMFKVKPMFSVVVRKIVDEVVDEFQPQITKKKLRLEKAYPPETFFVNADPSLVKIIFQNLFSNAVKYSYKGGTIKVTLKNNTKEWFLEVSDQGCGVPQSDQDKIFNKLFRGENARSMDPEGGGLGLYLVRSITKQVNGRIWFESELNKGSTFHVAFHIRG